MIGGKIHGIFKEGSLSVSTVKLSNIDVLLMDEQGYII
jgi:hypothetical protein